MRVCLILSAIMVILIGVIGSFLIHCGLNYGETFETTGFVVFLQVPKVQVSPLLPSNVQLAPLPQQSLIHKDNHLLVLIFGYNAHVRGLDDSSSDSSHYEMSVGVPYVSTRGQPASQVYFYNVLQYVDDFLTGLSGQWVGFPKHGAVFETSDIPLANTTVDQDFHYTLLHPPVAFPSDRKNKEGMAPSAIVNSAFASIIEGNFHTLKQTNLNTPSSMYEQALAHSLLLPQISFLPIPFINSLFAFKKTWYLY